VNNISSLKNSICHFEEVILNNFISEGDKETQKQKVNQACQSLQLFLEKNQQIIPSQNFLYCKEVIKTIILDQTLSEKKIGELFLQLTHLKDHCVEEKGAYCKLDMETFIPKLRELEIQMEAVTQARKGLAAMKNGVKEIVKEGLLNGETASKVGSILGKRFEAILEDLLIHAVNKLKMRHIEGPDLTQWSAVILGSLAREEGHPYSDIDLLILIDSTLENDEKTHQYFKALMQEFADLVHQVGEESQGFKLCNGNLTPPYLSYQNRYAHEGLKNKRREARGMGSFLATPERLACLVYQSAIPFMPMKNGASFFKEPQSGNENLIGAALLDAKPILGNTSLFDRFIELKIALGELKATELFDASHRTGLPCGMEAKAEQLMYRSILGSLTQKRSYADYEKAQFNIKQDFMRPIQVAIAVLANQFRIKETPTIRRLDRLAEMKIIPKVEAEKIKAAYLRFYQMRIEESVSFNGENDEVFISEEAFVKLKERFDQVEQWLVKLKQQERELIATKINGKEGMDDLVGVLQMKEDSAEEYYNLFKLLTFRKKSDGSVFQDLKKVSCEMLDAINGYIGNHCDKKKVVLI